MDSYCTGGVGSRNISLLSYNLSLTLHSTHFSYQRLDYSQPRNHVREAAGGGSKAQLMTMIMPSKLGWGVEGLHQNDYVLHISAKLMFKVVR